MISKNFEEFFVNLRNGTSNKRLYDSEGPFFVTNTITKRAGSLYERLRYTLDYQDENSIRRNAIERILRRVDVFETSNNVPRALLTELVQAGYIQNNTLPEAVTADIQLIINRYRLLGEKLSHADSRSLWTHASTEIEQFLFPTFQKNEVFTALYKTVLSYMAPREEGVVTDAEFEAQVFIACRRMFLHDTAEEIRFELWKSMEPNWFVAEYSDEDTERIASDYSLQMQRIDAQLDSDIHIKIEGRLHNESIYASLLQDIVRQYGMDTAQIVNNESLFEEKIRAKLQSVYQPHKAKIQRSAMHAIVYVLITKVLIGLAIELPFEIFVLNEVHFIPLMINILFFPILLLFMVKTISYPGSENTDHIVQGINKFLHTTQLRRVLIPVTPRSGARKFSFILFYFVLSLFSFGIIVTALQYLHFNITSILLFLFFLVIVSYFGFRIRYKSRAWTYSKEEDSTTGLFWYLVTMPILQTGKWISLKLSSINIFVFFMDFVLETPFKILLGSFDGFVSFAKEIRRDSF